MSNLNYKSPNSTLIEVSVQTSAVGKWLALIGSITLLSLPIGIISTIISMYQLFQEITVQGARSSEFIANGMSEALIPTILGLIYSLPGAILLCVSIVFFRHRRPWVFRVSIAASIVVFLLFPIGTVVSLIIIFMLVKHKHSFYVCGNWALNKRKQ
ncbi:MotA/TolQ/ExbB proton channel family protein [Microbulbifer spongiae]|uniref:MotA/TolQ/ExbB proton channel family protein n=1 Tax=Microbulbifer spongiae TaxID=2944933 RepID=A0ABY9EG96_9GAMM|nr:MotA/TolQ/ExbB proton channel family protein [Microbulbifer sp. MI-G]WKD51123.1 MotA/TolQ/ExbB proton channel family protein [Microbulbifer sp. MI-G]